MIMSFRLDWVALGVSTALGVLANTACQTPGEDYQESAAAGTGGAASNLAGASTSNAASSATTGSDGGGTNGATDTSSVDGAPQTNSTEGSASGDTTDGSASTDDGTSTGGSGSGGAANTDSGETTDGGGGGGNGSNLIVNGDFSSSEDPCVVDDSDWFTEGTLNWSGADEATCSYCVVLDPGQSGQLNWSGNSGTPPTLDAGTTYRFALDVWSPEGEALPTVSAKVGQPVDPYTGFLEEGIQVSNSQTTQSFTFTMDNSDQVGIALFLSAEGAWGKVCFDNIVIEPQ
jgi:hypothetical protein